MSSGLTLALLTLNLTQTDFVRMNRNNLKEYIEDFFKQEYVHKDFEKYKIAAKLALENKPRIEESKYINDNVNVEEESSLVRRRNKNHYSRNNSLYNPIFNPIFNPFTMFNSSFSNMMNEIDNLHRNFGNYNMEDNFTNSSANMMNGANNFTKSYSRTYVNNNGSGYIKEESMENNGKEEPQLKTFYRKIENGKYVEEHQKSL